MKSIAEIQESLKNYKPIREDVSDPWEKEKNIEKKPVKTNKTGTWEVKKTPQKKDKNWGWIKVHRSITQSPIFDDLVLIKMFLWFLTNVNFEKKNALIDGVLVEVQPGEIITSYRSLTNKLNIIGEDRQSIRRKALLLQSLDFVELSTNNQYTKIKIKNWEKYQSQ